MYILKLFSLILLLCSLYLFKPSITYASLLNNVFNNYTVSADTNTSDLNNDTKIDILDVLELIKKIFNTSYTFTNPNANPDINRDNTVNLLDVIALIQLVFDVTPTPTPTVNPTPTVTPTPTPSATPTITPTPTVTPTPVATNYEWTQHAFNAQRTSYNPKSIPTPWKWKWSFNGPNATGGLVSGKTTIPRNVQPITGNGKVFISAGSRGVYALDQNDKNNDKQADVLWNNTSIGTINSTPAYDLETNSLFVVSANGNLYKINADTGAILSTYNLGNTSYLPLPPLLYENNIYAGTGANYYSINKKTMVQNWTYNTQSIVNTPGALSIKKNIVVIVTGDLYVHAINSVNGTRVWRVKPTNRTSGDPGKENSNLAESSYGWPVIADINGLVIVKYRIEHDSLWTWNPWPTTNSQIRSNLLSNPNQQSQFVLQLNDGAVPFVSNAQNLGWGNSTYMPLGPMAVIKNFSDGTEVAYSVIRGDSRFDGNWDSQFGEMVLNNTTISGLQAGYVRWIQYGNFGSAGAGYDFPPSDEVPYISVAGNNLFGGHWALGLAVNINNRSSEKGTYTSPITTTTLPHFVASISSGGFNASHYKASSFALEPDYRAVPYGFYIYYGEENVYDRFWGNYAVWVIGDGLILYRSNDGAVVALESQ